ncbi:MAG TPA: Rv3235 family protein [Arachnia sp.]|nr:Rv3235 family protein [Arachnia sp.]HMT87680.1 Rv3235 family protein [Arachnia sp.]
MSQSKNLTVKLRQSVPAVPQLPTPAGPPPVPPVAEVLVRALIESMTGRRPLQQLRRRITRSAFATLAHHAETGAFRAAQMGGIRFQMPTPTAIEAVVRIAGASRWLACVVRLDLRGSWGCTDFAVLGVD